MTKDVIKYQFDIWSGDKLIIHSFAEPTDGKCDEKFKKMFIDKAMYHFGQQYPNVRVVYVGPTKNNEVIEYENN